MWRAEPVAEDLAVAEAGVDRVLEVRVRVDEARQDHRAFEDGARRGPVGDLDDPSVLPGDERVSQRRAVDREHPVGGDRRHVSTAGPSARMRRAAVEQDGEPDRALEEDHQRQRLEEDGDRVDARQRDREAATRK